MSERPTLFRTRRVAAEAAIALLLGIAFLVLGYYLGAAILEGLPRSENVRFITTGPNDLFVAQLKLGAVAAATPLVTLVALQLHRFGARAHPGWRPTLIYLAVPLAAVAIGVGAQVSGLHTVTRVQPMFEAQPHMVAIRSAFPGFLTTNLLAIATLVLWSAGFATARARRDTNGLGTAPEEDSDGDR